MAAIGLSAGAELLRLAQVYGLPTLILFKDGQKVEESHHEGAITRPNIANWLEKLGIQAAVKK